MLEGVKDGEQVVVAANFLIDAESNLKAAIGGFGAASGTGRRQGAGRARRGECAAPTAVGHQAEGTVDGRRRQGRHASASATARSPASSGRR